LRSWVDIIVDGTAEFEAPERFWYWAGLATIAACVKKNVYLDRYAYKLYPNMYVLLMAKSGGRKGNPPSLAKRLVGIVNNTRVISGRNTIEAILKDLGKAQTGPDGAVVKEATGFITSGELASLLVESPKALDILTDLYDTHAHVPHWKNTLKTAGVDTLKEPCINLLAATNEVHFKSVLSRKDIIGGFIARTIVVLEFKRRTINSLMYEPTSPMPTDEELSVYLKEVAKCRGKFSIEESAKKDYDIWYRNLAQMTDSDQTGNIERLGDTALKVAMNISLSYTTEMIITREHMDEAISKTIECVGGMKKVTMGGGNSDYAYATSIVLRELLDRADHRRTRKQILSKYWGEFDALTLDRIIETLVQTDAITAEREDKEIVYTMTPETVEAYMKFKKEVN
jgi:hypothetical protein